MVDKEEEIPFKYIHSDKDDSNPENQKKDSNNLYTYWK